MAIIKPVENTNETIDLNKLNEIPTHVVVDVDTPISKSTSYIGNGNWKIKSFYNQILASSDSASNFDPLLPVNEQQYDRIDNMVLSVITPMTTGNLSSLTGSSLIGSNIKPYVGDMFTADIDSNRSALFRINEVVLKNSALSKVYEITYSLDTTYENDPTKFDAINNSVARVYVYDDNSIFSMSGSVLLTEDYASKLKVEEEIEYIMDKYFSEFINDKNVLVSKDGVYDRYATTLMLRLYSGNKQITVKRTTVNLDNTIYELFLEQRESVIHNITHLGSVDSVDLFTYDGRLGSVRSGADKEVVSGISTPPLVTQNVSLPVAEDYLFSSSFMTDLTASSDLEELLYIYIHKDIITSVDIIKMIDSYKTFTSNERYFYTPILLMLYKYYISKMFSRR